MYIYVRIHKTCVVSLVLQKMYGQRSVLYVHCFYIAVN